jgi:hypothetical protein
MSWETLALIAATVLGPSLAVWRIRKGSNRTFSLLIKVRLRKE